MMWCFLPEVQPLKSKVKNAAERREANKKYDADARKRGFVESWREGREWLIFSEKEEKMQIVPTQRWRQKSGFFLAGLSQ